MGDMQIHAGDLITAVDSLIHRFLVQGACDEGFLGLPERALIERVCLSIKRAADEECAEQKVTCGDRLWQTLHQHMRDRRTQYVYKFSRGDMAQVIHSNGMTIKQQRGAGGTAPPSCGTYRLSEPMVCAASHRQPHAGTPASGRHDCNPLLWTPGSWGHVARQSCKQQVMEQTVLLWHPTSRPTSCLGARCCCQ